MNNHNLKAKEGLILNSAFNMTSEDDCACSDHGIIFASQECGHVDNDCACPDQPFGLINLMNTTGALIPKIKKPNTPHIQVGEHLNFDLSMDYHLVFNSIATNGSSVLDKKAWERWQDFQTPQLVVSELDQALADYGLVIPAGQKLIPISSQPQTFTAWLHVTNACNLDCAYCYVNKSNQKMDSSIGMQALERIFQTARQKAFKTVKLKYAGGEPFLNFKLIQDLQQYAFELAEESGLGLQAVILSNGTCINQIHVEWMMDNKVRLMLSMDGVGEIHDRQRPEKGKSSSSFNRLALTVDQVLLPNGLRPSISITITRQNASGVADTVRWALERDLLVSLNFYRQNTQSSSCHELDLDEETIITGLLQAYAVFEEFLPERPFVNGLLDRVQANLHTRTCGVGRSYIVITHEGKLAQCQMQMENAKLIQPGQDLLSVLLLEDIHNLPVDEKSDCASCLIRYHCTGGCPLETYRLTGRWDVPSPNCQIYRRLFPEILRLEGLRLLKENGYLH